MASDSDKTPPLSSATLHILLALAGGNLHGYGIIQEVARNSDGHYRLGPGTLYDNLKKLMDAGWVADAPAQRRKSTKEDDRRFYTLTRKGKDGLSAEVDRLQSVVSEAKLRLREARPGKA
jgi:DNA-binding PadR family transcriptional regulator